MNYKAIGLVTLCLALALPLLGQGPGGRRGRPPEGGFRQGGGEAPGPSIDRLAEVLELTAAQVVTFEGLIEQRKSAREAHREQMEAIGQTFQAAVESSDPLAIGNAFLARRALQEQLESLNQDLMAEFRNSLTRDQQLQLDTIQALRGERRGRGMAPGRFQGRGGRGPGGESGARPPARQF